MCKVAKKRSFVQQLIKICLHSEEGRAQNAALEYRRNAALEYRWVGWGRELGPRGREVTTFWMGAGEELGGA